jgi:F0F1-type ATP synthase assembly protein I
MKQFDNREPQSQDDTKEFLKRSTERFQERADKAVPTALASYALIGAIMVFGLIGYMIDRWRGGPSHLFLILGLLVGIVIGFANLVSVASKR